MALPTSLRDAESAYMAAHKAHLKLMNSIFGEDDAIVLNEETRAALTVKYEALLAARERYDEEIERAGFPRSHRL